MHPVQKKKKHRTDSPLSRLTAVVPASPSLSRIHLVKSKSDRVKLKVNTSVGLALGYLQEKFSLKKNIRVTLDPYPLNKIKKQGCFHVFPNKKTG